MTDQLPKRKLGASGIEVSAVGFGCMSLSGVYGPSDDDAGVALVQAAIDRGVTLIDTADMYGWGHNEQLVGRAIVGRRDRIVLSTKFGNLGGRDGKYADGRPEYVATACEASLKRLGVDVIDLYYQHRVDPNVPIEDTVGAMARLVQQGKVRALGLSEAQPDTVRRAHKVHPIAAVQNEYSLGISLVAYSPLGRGLLTARGEEPKALPEGDPRARHPRFSGDNFTHNRELVGRIETIARQKGCTQAQLVLAWLLAQGPDVIPIPGTKRLPRLEENIGALKVKLSADEVKHIADAIPAGAAAGTRYPEPQMRSVYL
jgi:aryl-alcohol dehydrogenase-like predicted oxidoreductase